MRKFGMREAIAAVIGIILFVALTDVQIPVPGVSNTDIQVRAALIAFLAAVFGPVVGGLVGFVGHAAGDAIFYYESIDGNVFVSIFKSIYWSWVIADAVFGILVGLFSKWFKIKEGHFRGKEIGLFNLIQIAANIVAWLVLAPLLDIWWNKEDAASVFKQGGVACLTNILVIAVLAVLTAYAYSKKGTKSVD
jgi:energy-coupling factor transport system substrate-specific component